MPKSMKLLLRISIILVLVLCSCSTNKVVQDYASVPLKKTIFEVPYFSNPAMDYVYKANITVYGHELTGIFIAKKINDTTHRVVFTTEFGNKLMDFEISEDNFKVNSIVSELDRKILINTLEEDFRLLLKKEYLVQEQFENESDNIYKSADGNRDNYLFYSKKNHQLEKIVRSSKTKEKFMLIFITENNIFAERVQIIHQNIKLKIDLNYFKSE